MWLVEKKTSKQQGEYRRLQVLRNQQASREDLHPTTAQIEYQPHTGHRHARLQANSTNPASTII